MSQQTIGVGASANDGTGDPLRTALTKANSNFTELYGNTSVGLQVPTTGFSITIAVATLLLNPAGTLATGTITMPAAPTDQQRVRVASSQTVTALTVSPNAGQSILGAPTTITVTSPFEYIYNLATTTWFRLQ